MDAMTCILTRRSVRRYDGRPVEEDQIRSLLEAAMSAPSSNNRQPWQFVVIDDRSLLDAIPTFHPYSKMLMEAPLAILVCGDLQRAGGGESWIQDCAAATQNILLAARALGLGSVWLGVHPAEDRVEGMVKLLDIPEGVIPFSLVALGATDADQQPVQRYDTERIHQNRWGK
jgi:nitroreductase